MAVGSSIGGQQFNGFDAEMGADPYLAAQMAQTPAWAQAATMMPGFIQSAGFTAFRGANTITGGGWAGRGSMTGLNRRINAQNAFTNNIMPRSWMQYSSTDIFKDGGYSPFNFASKGVNWAANSGKLGTPIKNMAMEGVPEGGKGQLLGHGMFGQINAAEKVGRMKTDTRKGNPTRKWQKTSLNVGSYLENMGMDVGDSFMYDSRIARRNIYQSMRGSFGGRVGGFMAAMGDANALVGADPIKNQAYIKGAEAFNRWSTTPLKEVGGFTEDALNSKIGKRAMAQGIKTGFAKEGMKGATKVAGSLALKQGARTALLAVPYVNVAMAAWMAYDVAKLAAKGVGGVARGTARLSIDAYKSFTGSSNQAMFGQNFRANEATLTSRSRGVQAIQNSRLNARSILGSEASMMAGYFG